MCCLLLVVDCLWLFGWLLVGCCLLFVVCRSYVVVCGMLCGVRCALFFACCVLRVFVDFFCALFVASCCLLVVCCCSLCVCCCLLIVDCCLLVVVCSVLFVRCCLFGVVCSLLFVRCCSLLLKVCWLVLIVGSRCCMLFVGRCSLCVGFYLSFVCGLSLVVGYSLLFGC